MTYEIRRSDHGYAVAITLDGVDVLKLVEGATRNEEMVEDVVKRLNMLPALRAAVEEIGKHRLACHAAKGDLVSEATGCGVSLGILRRHLGQWLGEENA